jgi:hypothetical protein
MAKRAKEGFVVALDDGKHRFDKNQVVPDKIAKHPGASTMVYDDGAPAKAAKP